MEERLQNLVAASQKVLDYLHGYEQTDSTPEGRMIAQCKWFIEQAEKGNLTLPVDQTYTSTLRHVYTEQYLDHTNDKDEYRKNVWIYLYTLMNLAVGGYYLFKPSYYPYALRSIDALIHLLENAPRKLDDFEQNAIPELQRIGTLLAEGKIEPPLGSYLPGYPNLNKVDGLVKYKPKSYGIPENTKKLIRVVTDLLFEGIRPDTWLTPEDADRETQNLQ